MVETILSYSLVGVTCFLAGRIVEWYSAEKIIVDYQQLVHRYGEIIEEYERMMQQYIQETSQLKRVERSTDPQLVVIPQRPYTLH